ncbi:MAG: hypothetical protein QOJ29_4743, partial [Thermoleophilaceae bacterium]|nr:hypothetical protein [Thermoleophilaceae bacterium]
MNASPSRGGRISIGALLAVCAVAAGAPAAAVAAVPRFEPAAHHDAAEFRKDPLDLRAAAFGQVGTQLSLTLRTRRAWSADGPADDSLCVTLLHGRPVGQMCIAADRSRRPIVRFRPARSGGSGYRRLTTVRGADVESSGRTLRVLVYPHALGLRPGRLGWFVRAGKDRLPDAGAVALRVSVYGTPRCFGAAARAGGSPCVNPALRRLVIPRPADAELMHDFPCQPHRHARRYKILVPCLFGARYAPGPTR